MKRTRVACDGCAKRKIKCDRAFPQCDWCKNQGLECTVSRSHRFRKKKSERDPQRESIATQCSLPGGENQGDGLPAMTGQVSHTEPLQLLGYNLGNLRAFNGMPFFSAGGREWVQERTGMSTVFPPGRFTQVPPLSYPGGKGCIAMPDRDTVSRNLTSFKESVFRQLFPLVDVDLFNVTIHMAYSHPDSPDSLDAMSARTCVFAFMAFTSSLFTVARESTSGECYALEARKLLSELLHHPATIDGLQTALFLTLYTQSTFGDLSSVDALISTASRFVYSLGGHLSPGPPYPPSRRSWHCRNLFWICYNIDRKVCLRTGRPPCLNDTCCDLTLPDEYIASLKREIPASPGYTEPIFLSDIRLSLIESKVFLELYAAPARGKSDAELLRTIRTLDTLVEQWKGVALLEEQTDLFDLQTAIFRMHYLYAVATIHQATTGCRAWIHDQGRTMEGVNSSLMISVDASRQLLRLISGTPDSLLDDGFWFSLFFFLSAGIILFCNVLNNPGSSGTEDDISLLELLATHVRENSRRRASPQVRPKIENTGRFAAEMVDLARCAVAKARMA